MKNSQYVRQAQYQKGFIVPLLIAIIAVLVIGGGVYIYNNKKAEAPTVINTGIQQEVQTQPIQNQQQVQGIVIEQPLKNQEVQLPITVKGYLNGKGWAAFEGVAGSVQVFDANNKAISSVAQLTATTDWMQSIVHFEATVGDRQMMSNLATQTGVLVFKNENPKGDVVDEKEFRLPIKFANTQTPKISTVTEKASGIIKSVYSKSGKNYIDIDYIEWNPNWAPGGGNGSVYQNSNPQLRTLEISQNAKFFVGRGSTDRSITFSDFDKIFNTPNANLNSIDFYQNIGVWDIVITNGVVTQITEHFLP